MTLLPLCTGAMIYAPDSRWKRRFNAFTEARRPPRSMNLHLWNADNLIVLEGRARLKRDSACVRRCEGETGRRADVDVVKVWCDLYVAAGAR